MTCNLISLNVRGIREAEKRRAIFQYYRTRCDILCLQETHSDKDTCDQWSAEWGGQAIYAHGTTNSRGVAILIKKSYNGGISVVKTDPEGRYVTIECQVNDKKICITSIYAPNKDSPMFFENVIKDTFERNPELVIVGDFNTTMSNDVDRNGNYCSNNSRATEKIQTLSEDLKLQDVWRARNENVKCYSWFRYDRNNKRYQASRLDYALISTGLSGKVHNCMYLSGIKSDHSALLFGFGARAD